VGGIGAKSVRLQVWLLVGGGDPQIEGRSRAVLSLGWSALPSIKVLLLRTPNRYFLSPSKQTLHQSATADPFLDTL